MSDQGRRTRRYYLSLGSNIRPAENLRAAVRKLRAYGQVISYAPLYSSPSHGDPSQPDYLNTAVMIDSPLAPEAFQNEAIAGIEAELGRVRTANRYAARTIDIDIVLVDRDVLMIGHRPIPSPEVIERAFVAVPLAAIAPGYTHPTDGRTLAEIAAGFPPGSVTEAEAAA